MKINRLKLVNFIGIKHGLDRNEVEIDFTKTTNKVIMLLGGNGAGKSVIMSMLHPFKESFDDRKDLILDGTTGEKEIDIVHNGHNYEIHHIYGKSAQSFIKKDGVELNENGGIRTFEDIVYKEFKITKDFFKIGKIGSNTKNFIDFSTAERKAYVAKFLNIEEILEKHVIANNKLKELNKDIKNVGSELSKFQNKDIIETTIAKTDEVFKNSEAQLTELYELKGTLNAKLENIMSELSKLTLSDITQKISEKERDVQDNKKIKSDLLKNNPNIEKDSELGDELEKEIQEVQSLIQVLNSSLNDKNLLKTNYINKVKSLEAEISALGNPEDLEKNATAIENCKNEISKISSEIRANTIAPIIHRMMKESKDINRYVDKTKVFLDFLEKFYTDLCKKSIIPSKRNIELFFDEDVDQVINNNISSCKKLLLTKNERLLTLQKERGIKETKICSLKNLEKRPSECTIDSCPFIKDAVDNKNVISEISKVDENIELLKKDIETTTIAQENLQELVNLHSTFKEKYSSLSIRDNYIYEKFVSERGLVDWVNNNLSEFQFEKEKFLNELNEAITKIAEYQSLKRSLDDLLRTKSSLEDKDQSLRNKLESDIKENDEKRIDVESEIAKIKKDIESNTEILNSKRILLDSYQKFIAAVSKYNSANTMLSTANAEFNKYKTFTNEKVKFTNELNSTLTSINNIETIKNEASRDLTRLNTSLTKINELEAKMKKLNEEFEPLSTIVNALSPKGGIPLILMKVYLEETENITNELLDIAFNGDFKVKFVTTDKEFAIQVEAKDNIKSDIKMASQGEIAITTISISLALIEQSIGEYNILCLDEMDGHLDSSNRTNFIDILNSQITKLGIEQVFIISHNDAFDTAPVGLVLLKGNNVNTENTSFMEGKDIIFDIKGE